MIIACCVQATNIRYNAERLNEQPEIDQEFDLIDFSYQGLSLLPEFVIQQAPFVKHLILDGNLLDEHVFDDVRFPLLESLSFNSNQVENIGVFIQLLAHKCPKLRFLSLIENPGWPHPLRGNDTQLYKEYSYAILKFFPKLRFLDSVSVEGSRKSSNASTYSNSPNQ